MHSKPFKTDDEWRMALVAQIIKLQLSIYELAGVVALIAISEFLGRWWAYSVLVGAGMALAYLAYAWRHEAKDFRRIGSFWGE